MKRKLCMILLIIMSISLIGCESKKDGIETEVYYINVEEYGIAPEVYFRASDNAEKSVKELLRVMENPIDTNKYQSAIPKEVDIEEFKVRNNQLEIVFDEGYFLLNNSTEVLMRAAIVKTLTQIPTINYVAFFVGTEPVKDDSGKPIGMFGVEDFVQNTGSSLKSYQNTDLKLYFANSDGSKLADEKRNNVHYNINTSIEKLVVEQLMKGTTSEVRSATISPSTKLLGVAVKDGICYVNFDSSFLSNSLNQKPEVSIYSIVNSIIVNGNVTKVQILVDGSSEVTYMGTIDLSSPLEWKADLIEE